MKLPNHHLALVPRGKIVDYLLSSVHREGRHKAAFFGRFGFNVDDWQSLASALQEHAAAYEVAKDVPTRYGTRYAVDGIIKTPDGRTAMVRTVWFVELGEEVPRFVTAYPLPRQAND